MNGSTFLNAASSPLANTTRSLVRACAPVPESGQSSSTMPFFASVSRARSLSSIGSVLVSITTRPLPASSFATSCSACALGSEVISTSASCASAATEVAGAKQRLALFHDGVDLALEDDGVIDGARAMHHRVARAPVDHMGRADRLEAGPRVGVVPPGRVRRELHHAQYGAVLRRLEAHRPRGGVGVAVVIDGAPPLPPPSSNEGGRRPCPLPSRLSPPRWRARRP